MEESESENCDPFVLCLPCLRSNLLPLSSKNAFLYLQNVSSFFNNNSLLNCSRSSFNYFCDIIHICHRNIEVKLKSETFLSHIQTCIIMFLEQIVTFFSQFFLKSFEIFCILGKICISSPNIIYPSLTHL